MPRLRRRPGDDRLKQPVGRDAPNRPDDVARLQRALSETGDYTFTAPRERSGVMTANLETAVTRYQRRTGLNPDGVVAPDGPTIQRVNAEADNIGNRPSAPSASQERNTPGPDSGEADARTQAYEYDAEKIEREHRRWMEWHSKGYEWPPSDDAANEFAPGRPKLSGPEETKAVQKVMEAQAEVDRLESRLTDEISEIEQDIERIRKIDDAEIPPVDRHRSREDADNERPETQGTSRRTTGSRRGAPAGGQRAPTSARRSYGFTRAR